MCAAVILKKSKVKRISIAVLLLLPILCQAQDKEYIVLTPDTAFHIYFKDKSPRKGRWVEYALFTAAIVSNAVGDGENSRTKYEAGHALNALSIGCLLAVPFVSKPSWKMPVTYIAIRYALFDGFYNAGAKRNINYRGGKNYYNEGVGHIPLGVFNASKIAALGFSLIINLK